MSSCTAACSSSASRGNFFHDNPAPALLIRPVGEVPRILARRNVFLYNDTAVAIDGPGTLRPGGIDLGRRDDPGDNDFVCNRVRGEPASVDVSVRAEAQPGARLWLSGNRWDRVPPQVSRAGLRPGHTAMVLHAVPAPALELERATKSATTCYR